MAGYVPFWRSETAMQYENKRAQKFPRTGQKQKKKIKLDNSPGCCYMAESPVTATFCRLHVGGSSARHLDSGTWQLLLTNAWPLSNGPRSTPLPRVPLSDKRASACGFQRRRLPKVVSSFTCLIFSRPLQEMLSCGCWVAANYLRSDIV